jgi:hypothetical protein
VPSRSNSEEVTSQKTSRRLPLAPTESQWWALAADERGHEDQSQRCAARHNILKACVNMCFFGFNTKGDE